MTHSTFVFISALLVKLACANAAPGEVKSFAPAYNSDKAVGDWNNKNSYQSDKANNKNAQAYNLDRLVDNWNKKDSHQSNKNGPSSYNSNKANGNWNIKGAYQSDTKRVRGQPRNSNYNDVDNFRSKKQPAYSGNNVDNFNFGKPSHQSWKPMIKHFVQEKSFFSYNENPFNNQNAYSPNNRNSRTGPMSQRNMKPNYNSNDQDCDENSQSQKGYNGDRNNQASRKSPKSAYNSNNLKNGAY